MVTSRGMSASNSYHIEILVFIVLIVAAIVIVPKSQLSYLDRRYRAAGVPVSPNAAVLACSDS